MIVVFGNLLCDFLQFAFYDETLLTLKVAVGDDYLFIVMRSCESWVNKRKMFRRIWIPERFRNLHTSFGQELNGAKTHKSHEKANKSWKFVYILARQSRYPFNLTIFLTKFNILISRTCLYTLRKLLHLYLYYTSPVFPGKPGILLSAFWLVLGSCSFFFPPIGSGRSFFSIRVRPLNVYKTAAAGFIDFPAIFSIFLTDFLPGKYMLSALFLDFQGF